MCLSLYRVSQKFVKFSSNLQQSKGTIQSKKKKKNLENSRLGGRGGSERGQFSRFFLKCVEWSNSSRNAKKIFSLCEGGQGGSWVGPQLHSEDQFCLTFSRGKNEFFQSCSEWCQKLKNNRLYFSAFGGGGIKNPKCRIFVIFFAFLTLYPSLSQHLIILKALSQPCPACYCPGS